MWFEGFACPLGPGLGLALAEARGLTGSIPWTDRLHFENGHSTGVTHTEGRVKVQAVSLVLLVSLGVMKTAPCGSLVLAMPGAKKL